MVFLRDQDLSPQKQLELGAYFGEVEVNPQDAYVPGLPGATVVWFVSPLLKSKKRDLMLALLSGQLSPRLCRCSTTTSATLLAPSAGTLTWRMSTNLRGTRKCSLDEASLVLTAC